MKHFLFFSPLLLLTLSSSVPSKPSPAQNYATYCASCHGENMEAFIDRNWEYGQSDEDLFKGIKMGYEDDGMPGFGAGLTNEEITELVDYIQINVKNADAHRAEKQYASSNLVETEELTIRLDTIIRGIDIPWGLTFLPNGDMLVTERSGTLYNRTSNGDLLKISGIPKVKNKNQAGLLDVEIHPDYNENGWIYLAYSKLEPGGGNKSTTAILRGKLKGANLVEVEEIFKSHSYSIVVIAA